jgi:hypothetical protein
MASTRKPLTVAKSPAPESGVFRLAIVSDLHCHAPEKDEKGKVAEQHSLFLAGAPRLPSQQHPVQALFDLIAEGGLKADLLLCAGDISHQACGIGLHAGWSALQELRDRLGCTQMYATLGNHDIDSRRQLSPDPFALPKNSRPDLPCLGDKRTQFFEKGFYLDSPDPDTTVAVINSVVDHHDPSTAGAGTFDASRVQQLVVALDGQRWATRRRIALLHHHPMLHTGPGVHKNDVLPDGDVLLGKLKAAGFHLVVHGHRHNPRIAFDGKMAVIASGSFSAVLRDMWTWTRNLFHIVELSTDEGQSKGTMLSWEFGMGVGWRKATQTSASIPHVAGFGAIPSPQLINDVAGAVKDNSVLDLAAIQTRFPDLARLSPEDLRSVITSLETGYGTRLALDDFGQMKTLSLIVGGRPNV